MQLMLGMGGATILCAIAFFAWKATHKTQAIAPPAASSAAPSPISGPMHAFTMAPIEFTAPVASGSAAEDTAAPSAHASTSVSTSATSTATSKPSSTTHAVPTTSGKPPKTDELIKVEN
jgi:hypothetical protein